MQVEVVVILISTLGSLVGTFSGIVVSSRITTYRLKELEKKVEKHNNVIERMAAIEIKTSNIFDSLELAHSRISEVKEIANVNREKISVLEVSKGN